MKVYEMEAIVEHRQRSSHSDRDGCAPKVSPAKVVASLVKRSKTARPIVNIECSQTRAFQAHTFSDPDVRIGIQERQERKRDRQQECIDRNTPSRNRSEDLRSLLLDGQRVQCPGGDVEVGIGSGESEDEDKGVDGVDKTAVK